ncbi:MAG: hypothetical protein WCA32_21365 [Chromatiaceae bacterium]
MFGYTPDGFIVQNSWGLGRGFKGFDILTVEDWVRRGSDAWVTVMGATMAVRSARTFSTCSLIDTNAGKVLQVHNNKRVSDGVEQIPLAHGSFDNDHGVMTATLERILGAPLAAPIENLHGF